MKMNNHPVLRLALPACLCLCAARLHAEDLICDNGTFVNLPPLVDGDVIVTNGTLARLPLGGTSVVTGDVIVSDGGRLGFRDVLVEGDIVSDGGDLISISRSTIEGDVEILHQGAAQFSIFITQSVLGGDVLITDNDARTIAIGLCVIDGDVLVAGNDGSRLSIGSNEVGGSMFVFDNVAVDGILLDRNTILGDLLCGGNDPDPNEQQNVVFGDIICED